MALHFLNRTVPSHIGDLKLRGRTQDQLLSFCYILLSQPLHSLSAFCMHHTKFSDWKLLKMIYVSFTLKVYSSSSSLIKINFGVLEKKKEKEIMTDDFVIIILPEKSCLNIHVEKQEVMSSFWYYTDKEIGCERNVNLLKLLAWAVEFLEWFPKSMA